MTTVRRIDADTVVSLLDLTVRPDQAHFVAPNSVTIAQSIFEGGSEVYGLYDGETPVGLMAMVDMTHPEADLAEGDEPNGLYLWRLMVDQAHQQRGHGGAALAFLDETALSRGRVEVATSAVPAAGTAIPFYEAYGFIQTGRMDGDEVELIKRLPPKGS